MSGRVLVAGVGNVFLGDDGFGPEVARALTAAALPDGVEVADYGIRGVHLAYQLCDGYDELVLVDACPRGGEPGTLYLIEPDPVGPSQPPAEPGPVVDAHDMSPDSVLRLLGSLTPHLGGGVERVRVVGCEPADTSERMGLSPPVAAAVPEAVGLVRDLLTGHGPVQGGTPGGRSGRSATRGEDDAGTRGEAGRGRSGGGGGGQVVAGHPALPEDQEDVTTAHPGGRGVDS